MKIGIISGSHRKNSESDRIANFINSKIKELSLETYFCSLASNPLPLWDESVWAGSQEWKSLWSPISLELKSCDGFVIVSPEWSGMVPAGLKNFFLLCGGDDLAHKPGMIVSVSSGIGGSYPVAELRTSSYKNTRLCYIPDHIIIRNCTSMLNETVATEDRDKSLRDRIDYSLKVLIEYAKALSVVRKSGCIDLKTYPHGM
jgi:NAD(P)H-dependent FMN reductase